MFWKDLCEGFEELRESSVRLQISKNCRSTAPVAVMIIIRRFRVTLQRHRGVEGNTDDPMHAVALQLDGTMLRGRTDPHPIAQMQLAADFLVCFILASYSKSRLA